jgi:hypothetical protein
LNLQGLLNLAANAAVPSSPQMLQQATAYAGVVGGSTGGGSTCGHVVVCSTDGTVSVLQLQQDQAIEGEDPARLLGDQQQELQAESCRAVMQQSVVVPGEVFSSPVVLDGLLVLGCRDDFLYCIKHNSA